MGGGQNEMKITKMFPLKVNPFILIVTLAKQIALLFNQNQAMFASFLDGRTAPRTAAMDTFR